MSGVVDITGQRFGKLTAHEKLPASPGVNGALWRCLCDCGKETTVLSQNLRYGLTKSCGCLKGNVHVWTNGDVKNPNSTRDWMTPWRRKNSPLFTE